MEIFAKVLTDPDLERRLSFSSNASLQALPQFKGCPGIVLNVKDEDGIFWNFDCVMIGSGSDPKLAMVSGWIKFARTRGLQKGDRVVLHKEEDGIGGTEYKIQVKKISSCKPQPTVISKPKKTNTHNLWVKLKVLKLLKLVRSSFYV